MGDAQKVRGQEHVELFSYPVSLHSPEAPEWQGWFDPSDPVSTEQTNEEQPSTPDHATSIVALEKRLSEETHRSFEAGRERGRQEGLQSEREAHATAQRAAADLQRQQHAELVRTFAEERDLYLHAVEHEVVKLALAVAARILRREAQMDPLLLLGAVRVALGQLSSSTEVRLRVPAAELSLWSEAIALIPNLTLKPVVKPMEGMRLGDCILETSMGTVDLGIRSQLGEIESGFFDRAGSGAAQSIATKSNHSESHP